MNVKGMPLGAALCALTLAGMNHADTFIHLDLQDHATADANNAAGSDFVDPAADGAPPLQNLDHQWNYHSTLTSGSSTALNHADGNASGITYTLLTDVSGSFKNNPQLGGSAPFDDVGRDAFFAGGATTIDSKLSGLDTSGNTTYDLYIIGANLFANNWMDIVVTDGQGTSTRQLTSADDGVDSVQYTGGPLVQGVHYEVFSGLTPDSNGEIAFGVAAFNGGSGDKYLSGIQIVARPIPEPGAMVLFGLGPAILLARKRVRR